MKTVEWIFFDVGSTLMNEEKAYLHRLRDVADAVNAVMIGDRIDNDIVPAKK